uniref:uncharacterized protein n=1 Tax=Pristiophorus japonicus TaxID=55135 RepID=UPI00398F0573
MVRPCSQHLPSSDSSLISALKFLICRHARLGKRDGLAQIQRFPAASSSRRIALWSMPMTKESRQHVCQRVGELTRPRSTSPAGFRHILALRINVRVESIPSMELLNINGFGFFLSILSVCGFLLLCTNCFKFKQDGRRAQFNVIRPSRDPIVDSLAVGQTGIAESENSVTERPVSTSIAMKPVDRIITVGAGGRTSRPATDRERSDNGDDDGCVSYVNLRTGEEEGTYVEVLPTDPVAMEPVEQEPDLGSYENLPSVTDALPFEDNDYENLIVD